MSRRPLSPPAPLRPASSSAGAQAATADTHELSGRTANAIGSTVAAGPARDDLRGRVAVNADAGRLRVRSPGALNSGFLYRNGTMTALGMPRGGSGLTGATVPVDAGFQLPPDARHVRVILSARSPGVHQIEFSAQHE